MRFGNGASARPKRVFATTRIHPKPPPASAIQNATRACSRLRASRSIVTASAGPTTTAAATRHHWNSAANDSPKSAWTCASIHIAGLRKVAALGSGVIVFGMNSPWRDDVTQDQYCAWSGTSNIRPV